MEGLIDAFRIDKDMKIPNCRISWSVAGKPGWKFQDIFRKSRKIMDIVVYLNHVSEADKAGCFIGADLLVLPSFYEGFGMQILEGFAAGVPVQRQMSPACRRWPAKRRYILTQKIRRQYQKAIKMS